MSYLLITSIATGVHHYHARHYIYIIWEGAVYTFSEVYSRSPSAAINTLMLNYILHYQYKVFRLYEALLNLLLIGKQCLPGCSGENLKRSLTIS